MVCLFVLLCAFAFVECMQYVDILTQIDPINDMASWTQSFVSFANDIPFEKVILPFPFRFYDKTIYTVWISPNGYISMKPGYPCGRHFASSNCSVNTIHYDAIIAPFVFDLEPYASLNATVRFRLESNQLSVLWDDIPGKTYSIKNSFLAILKEGGSVVFCYKNIFIGPIADGFIGLRPFLQATNYSTHVAPISSSQSSWKTDIPGNYLRQDHLNWITNQFAQPRHFLYQSAVQFVLAPTTFCIRPTALVKTAQMNLTLSFSWLEPSIQSSQLRCVLERNVIASVVRLSLTEIICIEPDLSNVWLDQSKVLSLEVYIYSEVTMTWIPIPTTIPQTITLFESFYPAPPISLNATYCSESGHCDRCGQCINLITIHTITPNQCVGVDNQVYGHPSNECSPGEILDSRGICCQSEKIDCEGVCNGKTTPYIDQFSHLADCCRQEVSY